jgi:nucleoside-diphosphate-sugar epimerase
MIVRSNLQNESKGEAMSTVLVTGGSGFIGAHAILQLLSAGHQVRTTVRNLKREPDVRAMLKVGGADTASLSKDRLAFFTADLEEDAGWKEAVAGCDYVHHLASPLPPNAPKHEDELIIPARDGALRVLRASRDGGVKRVVMTSSFGAIGYGHAPQTAPFNEKDWSDLTGTREIAAYPKSKTLAERAAWDFIAKEGGGLELSVINPVAVFGPVLGPDYSPSILIVQKLMNGALPGCPRFSFGLVDVRDVVDLHLRAMTNAAAKGERFLAVAGENMWMLEVAKLLKTHMGNSAKRVPTRQLPDMLLRLAALRDPAVKLILPELGIVKGSTGEKARRVLGWAPRSNEESVLASAESLVRLGLLKDSPNKKAA